MIDWISIYQLMPKNDKSVLVWFDDDYDLGVCWENSKPRKSKWNLEIRGSVDNEFDDKQVLLWMPLPDPPEDEP